MRVFSVFSISLLSLSVWGLFLTLYNTGQPDVQVGLDPIEDQYEITQEEQVEEPPQTSDTTELDQDQDLGETESEPEQAEDESVVTQVIEDEEIPMTLEARASSRYNDILYDYEKDHPISVDDLLYLLNVN